jgi:hypothetical protein
MRELRSEVVGERRVRLIIEHDGHYSVTIEIWTGAWEDISLRFGSRSRSALCASVLSPAPHRAAGTGDRVGRGVEHPSRSQQRHWAGLLSLGGCATLTNQ